MSTDQAQSNQDPNQTPNNEKVAVDKVVSFHYRMALVGDDGTQQPWLEESFDDEPVSYLHGHRNVIVGLEEALLDKAAGDEITVTIGPDKAYGARHPNALRRVPVKHVHRPPGLKKFVPGMIVAIQTDQGARNVEVIKVGKFNLDVDLNHPLAGKTLHYEIKIVEVRPASGEEIKHGHAHGPGGHHH